MKVVIVGKSGQLAQELISTCPREIEAICLGRMDINIMCPENTLDCINDAGAELVINASAYTAVDKAESDQDNAYAINRNGVENIAKACNALDIRLFHVSTDFVFGSSSALANGEITPLKPQSPTAPLGVYGRSKLAGETAIKEVLGHQALIVRTAWVYSVYGNNFVKTMLKLMADKPHLSIVYDQIGTPTWAKALAQWLWAMVKRNDSYGVYHWTDSGVASWYDFAKAIQALAYEKGVLRDLVPISPIPASEYPTPAKRPTYSVLDKTSAEQLAGLKASYWRENLSQMLSEYVNLQSEKIKSDEPS